MFVRRVYVNGAENIAERAENRVERRAERWAGVAENDGVGEERSAEREVAERERSGERAESAAHSPAPPNIVLTFTVRTLQSAVYCSVFTL